MLTATEFLVLGVITMGLGFTVAAYNWSSRSSRPMAAFLMLLGLNLMLGEPGTSRPWNAMIFTLHALTFSTAALWASRIGVRVTGRPRKIASVLFGLAQLAVLVYLIIGLIYAFALPIPEVRDGIVRSSGMELAIFSPLVGLFMLLAVLGGLTLRYAITDSADKLRLLIVGAASPFLLSGLVLNEQIVPFTIAVGILILITGLFRYQLILGQRGSFMSQFLAPEVAALVRAQGMDRVMRRERRVISVVMCDLRGFTAYAREHDSDDVVTLLEDFYKAVGSSAAEFGGTIKDHAGDGVMLLVGAPIARPDHARQALLLATDIMQAGQQMLKNAGLNGEIGLGIGVATGQITVGTIRGAGQLEYVAVGNAVNLAARLCDRAENGQILADRRTSEAAPDRLLISAQEPEPLKGFPEPIEVCSVGRSVAA